MRALLQRVAFACVTVEAETVAEIGPGLCVFVAVHRTDERSSADRLASKVLQLRVFDDSTGRMNRSVADCGAEILCVSQFTLYADTGKGNRPSYAAAAPPELAEPLYRRVCDRLGAETGRFGARMAVRLENEGPVTLLVDT